MPHFRATRPFFALVDIESSVNDFIDSCTAIYPSPSFKNDKHPHTQITHISPLSYSLCVQHKAFALSSMRHQGIMLFAMPYIYQGEIRLCFIHEIRRTHDVLVKGIKALRPIPSGILKHVLGMLKNNYCVISENLAHITAKQEIDSPFLLHEQAILHRIEFLPQEQLIYVEIGFGSGRHILHMAKNHPNALIIGLEIHTPSIEQVLRHIDLLGLNNVYVAFFDARLFCQCVKSKSLHRVFIHFPVPWNHAKHRRVISSTTLHHIISALVDDGVLEFRTDDRAYYDDVLDMARHISQVHIIHTINTPQDITSKYEARWLRANKDIFTITLKVIKTPRQRDVLDTGALGSSTRAKPSMQESSPHVKSNMHTESSMHDMPSCHADVFCFDEGLIDAVLQRIAYIYASHSAQGDMLEHAEIGTVFARLWERHRFLQGVLRVYDVYGSAQGDKVAFLLHMGDGISSCVRMVLFEKHGSSYMGRYFPEAPLASWAYLHAHALFIRILEHL